MKYYITDPLDMHVHLRQDEMLTQIAHHTADQFSAALVMPNTVPPITGDNLLEYKRQIKRITRYFVPLMTVYFRDYSFDELDDLKRKNVCAIKLYPKGVTTNSDMGIELDNFVAKYRMTLEGMQRLHIPLCVHGETCGFVMDRESEFLKFYDDLCPLYPDLVIIMEHITSEASLEYLEKYRNLYATVTLHHLMITLDDVVGHKCNNLMYCKPVAKGYKDRDALRKAVFAGHPKIMFGSDSAPHPIKSKYIDGCAGIFSAPVLLPLLVQLFVDANADWQCFMNFVSENAKRIYKLHPHVHYVPKTVILESGSSIIPMCDGEIPVFHGGKTCYWKIVSE